jgi:hypothetical protein
MSPRELSWRQHQLVYSPGSIKTHARAEGNFLDFLEEWSNVKGSFDKLNESGGDVKWTGGVDVRGLVRERRGERRVTRLDDLLKLVQDDP